MKVLTVVSEILHLAPQPLAPQPLALEIPYPTPSTHFSHVFQVLLFLSHQAMLLPQGLCTGCFLC